MLGKSPETTYSVVPIPKAATANAQIATGNLQRSLYGISRKMLVQTLRNIEQRGLVYRYIYDTIPPKVEYELTPLGRKFAESIEALYLW